MPTEDRGGISTWYVIRGLSLPSVTSATGSVVPRVSANTTATAGSPAFGSASSVTQPRSRAALASSPVVATSRVAASLPSPRR